MAAKSSGRSHSPSLKGWCVAAVAALMIPGVVRAQTRLQSYFLGNGGGFSSGESVRFGVSLGQPMNGIARNFEAAGGAGFWYATRNRLVIVGTESDVPEGIPEDFELHANYPNPFNPTTRIRYGVPKNAFVTIRIFNVLGRLVSELVAAEKQAGYYDVDWNGRDNSGAQAPSGLYFYRFEADRFQATRSMILLK